MTITQIHKLKILLTRAADVIEGLAEHDNSLKVAVDLRAEVERMGAYLLTPEESNMSKFDAIRSVRVRLSLGLKEAHDLVCQQQGLMK